jgi:hypothetical protein
VGQDRDEGELDETNEMRLYLLKDANQPLVAADPCQRALNDPSNALRNGGSVMATGVGLDGDAERLELWRKLGDDEVRKVA